MIATRDRISSVGHGSIAEDGRVTFPQAFYPCLSTEHGTWNANDPWQETSYSFSVSSGLTETILASRRGCYPTRWTTAGGDAGSVSWLRRRDGAQGFLPNERWREDQGLGSEKSHNPTMQASGLLPPGLGDRQKWSMIPFSPSVFFKVTGDGRTGTIEGCTIPLDFDSFGFEVATNARGGDMENLLLWWRCRQYLRIDVNVQERLRTHRATMWSYFPKTWTGSPFVGHIQTGLCGVNYFGLAGTPSFFYDPVTRTQQSVGAGWGGTPFGAPINTVWTANGHTRQTDVTGSTVRTDAYPFSRNYGAAVLVGDVGGNAFCLWCYLVTHRDSNSGNQQQEINQLQIATNVQDANVGYEYTNGQYFSMVSKALDYRAAGWLGQQWIFGTANNTAEALVLIDAAHRARLCDSPPTFSVPKAVIDGMDPGFQNRLGPARPQAY